MGPFAVRYAGYLAVLALDWGVVHVLCGLVSGPLPWVLAARLAICAVVGDGLLLALYCRRREFKTALGALGSVVGKLRARLARMPLKRRSSK